jgi:lipopolysaccharide biosynthesis regulator YciM
MLTDAVAQLADGGTADEAAEVATALGQFHRSRGEHDLAAKYTRVAFEAAQRSNGDEAWTVSPVV